MKTTINKTLNHLRKKKKILFLATSNRWEGDNELAKSTLLAKTLAEAVGNSKVTILDIPRLKIYNCEGNISRAEGNNCGILKAQLKDKNKNPSGHHRCWASINNKDDELWIVSKALFESDCVMFFGSVRWGQMNAQYQKLIERLSWIENRHSTLGEKNIIKGIDAGIIIVGQNWNGKKVLQTQKKVLEYFGFNRIDELCWNWQYTKDLNDESQSSYKLSARKFEEKVLSLIKDNKQERERGKEPFT